MKRPVRRPLRHHVVIVLRAWLPASAAGARPSRAGTSERGDSRPLKQRPTPPRDGCTAPMTALCPGLGCTMASSSDSGSELEEGQQQGRDWEEWNAEDGDEEEERTVSLFSSTVLPSPEAALEHDAQQHGFDLRQHIAQHRLSEYDAIQLINFIRSEVAAGRDPRPGLAAAAAAEAAAQQQHGQAQPPPWSQDRYLMPVLPDDPLLAFDFDAEEPACSREPCAAPAGPCPPDAAVASSSGSSAHLTAGLKQQQQQQGDRVRMLEEEVEALRLRLAALTDLPLLRELLEGQPVDDVPAAPSSSIPVAPQAPPPPPPPPPAEAPSPATSSGAPVAAAAAAAGGGAASAGPSGAAAAAPAGGSPHPAAAAVALAARSRVDRLYFESYSYFDIHREMLGDKARTDAYRDALLLNPGLLKGARVLDVGCGTGILSMLAARAGAAAVVGLEASDRMAGFARQVVEANGLSGEQGGPVSIVAGRVEDVQDIGLEQVDVIVSEWMGYALLFETMLDSVLVARDRWLRPGGAMLPDVAVVKLAGATGAALDLDFWQDVYGFSMCPIADQLRGAAAGKVHVREVPSGCLATAAAAVHRLQLDVMTPAQQDFTSEFVLEALDPAPEEVEVCALVLWFDVEFSAASCREAPVTLSTSPAAPATHWVQAVMPLQPAVALGAGGALAGRISMARSRQKHRTLDISLEYGARGGDGRPRGPRSTAVFVMEVTGE